MGKRIGKLRLEALVENMSRELDLKSSTLRVNKVPEWITNGDADLSVKIESS